LNDETGRLEPKRDELSPEKWAEHKGIKAHYDLPSSTNKNSEKIIAALEQTNEEGTVAVATPQVAAKYTDSYVQTLLFPDKLETTLRKIRSRANSAIEESGVNILYLAFGFLKWFESQDSDVPLSAPLFLIPITINKASFDKITETFRYDISHTGEDIIPNLSLLELMKHDFSVALPDLDNSRTPEEYFDEVEKKIHTQPRWKVQRQGTIGFFNFSKLLMWRDLDPKNWPTGPTNILNHPMIERFFTSKEGTPGSISSNQESYDIDNKKNVHENYPIIEDADSSQHSALIDVIDGKDLIIEGPPGTGKSQTITNIIASALKNGKTILFIADKLVALEVVKRRLDLAGLGDFCLELHSHKIQKRKVLEDIDQRLKNQDKYRDPPDIDVDIQRYEELKEKLNKHAAEVNEQWKETGFTISQILCGYTRYRDLIDLDPNKIKPSIPIEGDSFTKSLRQSLLDDLDTYQDVFKTIIQQSADEQTISTHPWFGVKNTDMTPVQIIEANEALDQWAAAAHNLEENVIQTNELLGIDQLGLESLHSIESFTTEVPKLEDTPKDAIFELIPRLKGEKLNEFAGYVHLSLEIMRKKNQFTEFLATETIDDCGACDRLSLFERFTSDYSVSADTTLASLSQFVISTESALRDLEKIEAVLSSILAEENEIDTKELTNSLSGLSIIADLVRVSTDISPINSQKRSPIFDREETDTAIERFQHDTPRLIDLTSLLRDQFNLNELGSINELIQCRAILKDKSPLSRFRRAWRDARAQIRKVALNPSIRSRTILHLIDSLVEYAEVKASYDKSRFPESLGDCYDGLSTNIDELIEIRSWYKSVRKVFGFGYDLRAQVGQLLLTINSTTLQKIQNLHKSGFLDKTRELIDWFNDLEKEISFDHESKILGPEGILENLQKFVNEGERIYDDLVIIPGLPIGKISDISVSLQKLHEDINLFESSNLPTRLGFEAKRKIISSQQTEFSNSLEVTLSLASRIQNEIEDPIIQLSIEGNSNYEHIQSLIEVGTELISRLAEFKETQASFVEIALLKVRDWYSFEESSIEDVRSRIDWAVENNDSIGTWLQFVRLRNSIEQRGFKALFDTIDRGALPIDNVEEAFLCAVNYSLSMQIFAEKPHLNKYPGHHLENYQSKFSKYDKSIMKLQQARIGASVVRNEIPIGNSGGLKRDYSELSLIRNEISKKTRFVPIRQLMIRAGDALIAMKPCFMMGPMSVAQFINPGTMIFDLVIMDEASQIRPEEALGAIARGRQTIIVGDPNQLPPTTFFDRILIDDDDDEVTAVEGSESILEAVSSILPMRQLKWHYRSRHESLIRFSNSQFYNSDLVVFPSPHKESEEFGVKHRSIESGIFKNRRNIKEAGIVASAVKEHLITRRNESLGVVTMNSTQREQIEIEIENLSKYDVDFRSALEQDQIRESEPLFIKNLENVQGDERDVIFISTTYGPETEGGKVMQRFGPITHDVGWRRLNVLFTRAKKRMKVFTSMRSTDILLSERSRGGTKALHDFLLYAETGKINITQQTGKPPDSDFEIAVANRLLDSGFETEFQVGVAGYYIDLAVKDPDRPGEHVMGIECDGATYHSARTARDRDRLRQEVLEGLGWEIRRIWSTDWFQNANHAMSPILKRLAKLTYNPIVALRQQLIEYHTNILSAEYPDIPDGERLLRPEMIDALIKYMPTTREDFLDLPLSLRENVDLKEEPHLDKILRMISDAKSD